MYLKLTLYLYRRQRFRAFDATSGYEIPILIRDRGLPTISLEYGNLILPTYVYIPTVTLLVRVGQYVLLLSS